jgi:hypothetical protein
MNIDATIDLDALHATIIAAIAAEFPALQTVEFYREDRTEVTAPACLLNLSEFEGDGEDPGTGQLAVMCRFEAEIIMGFRTPAAKQEIRKLCAAFSAFLHRARWPGGRVTPAQDIHAYQSDFKPALDQYEVWTIEWKQGINLGANVWAGEGVTPTTVFLGDVQIVPTP